MRTKNLLGLIVAMAVGVACSGGGGADAPQKTAQAVKDTGPKAVLNQMADLSEALVTALEKADKAEAVAAAFNAYSDGMERLIPQINTVMAEHPELKGKVGTKGVEVPAEFKPAMDRIAAAGDKMWDAMKKAEPFLKEEVVRKAQERFSAVMTKMQ